MAFNIFNYKGSLFMWILFFLVASALMFLLAIGGVILDYYFK